MRGVLGGAAVALVVAITSANAADVKSDEYAEWVKSIEAAGWTYAKQSTDGMIVFYQPAAGEPKQAWTRYELPEPTGGLIGMRSAVVLFEFDCARRAQRSIQQTSYGKNNLTQPLPTLDPDGKWEVVVPGSVSAGVLDALCR